MWTALVLMASVTVTECAAQEVKAIVGKEVLLPCSCSPEKKQKVVWQIDHVIVNQYNNSYKEYTDHLTDVRFKNRTRLFLREEKGNCSLLIYRVFVADGKTYRCHSYRNGAILTHMDITLTVSADYSAQAQCSREAHGRTVYQCKAWGGYPVGRISWLRDGQPVQNPSPSPLQDKLTSLYNLTSNLTINNNDTVQCVVERDGQRIIIKRIICPTLPPSSDFSIDEEKQAISIAVPVVIVILVAALTVALVALKKHRHRCQTQRDPQDTEATQQEMEHLEWPLQSNGGLLASAPAVPEPDEMQK